MDKKLIYSIVAYNGVGEHTVDSGEFTVSSKSDLNKAIALLERTAARCRSKLDLDLLGTFNKDMVLPVRYVRVIN